MFSAVRSTGLGPGHGHHGAHQGSDHGETCGVIALLKGEISCWHRHSDGSFTIPEGGNSAAVTRELPDLRQEPGQGLMVTPEVTGETPGKQAQLCDSDRTEESAGTGNFRHCLRVTGGKGKN